MLSNLISKVFVINLKKSTDRREHVIKEFERIGIESYVFFDGVDADSTQVTQLMNSDFVMSYPPCFRCNNIDCMCDNNVLVKEQIGNWCSFINLMKDIIKNNYQNLIMICEDDIMFIDNGLNFINKMINPTVLNKYMIDMSKPLLIKLEGKKKQYNLQVDDNISPEFIKTKTLSNACFIINKEYAISFINNLDKIKETSDVYIHLKLINKDKTIQHYLLYPPPAYQLSFCKKPQFYSLIHPKGIDEYDIERQKKHIKRVIHKKFLCIGHSRCGTTSASYYLSQMGYDVQHQHMGKDGTSSWMMAVNDDNYPYSTNLNKLHYYFDNIIHIVRNPFNAIPSIIIGNKYAPFNESYVFKINHIKKQLGIDIPLVNFNETDFITQIELAILTFIYWNKLCQLNKPNVVCKIEDITPLQQFNIKNKKIIIEHKNKNKPYAGVIYPKPEITMDMYRSLSKDLKKNLYDFCCQYGYQYIIDDNQHL
jgi:GR25 family glycosyltransferase involved in LPS biosynthesis